MTSDSEKSKKKEKFIQIRGLRDVSPPDLDGHEFRLSLDVGEVVGTEFVPFASEEVEITVSGTLQTQWGLPDSQIMAATGSLGASTVLNRTIQGLSNPYGPINFNTFSGPPLPPTFRMAAPGSLIPIPEPEEAMSLKGTGMQITFLSDNISEIRDQINTFSGSMLGEKLLQLPQERQLIDMYKNPGTAEEFSSRIQSLAGLAVALNKKAMLSCFVESRAREILKRHNILDLNSVAPLVLLEELLTDYSDADSAKSCCEVFKKLNTLRQGYPTHGDFGDKVLESHKFFGVRYPVKDYSSAWESILKRYFGAMKSLLSIIEEYHYKNVDKVAGSKTD